MKMSSNSDNNEPFNLKNFLHDWAISFGIRDLALTSLLHGLNKSDHNELPLENIKGYAQNKRIFKN